MEHDDAAGAQCVQAVRSVSAVLDVRGRAGEVDVDGVGDPGLGQRGHLLGPGRGARRCRASVQEAEGVREALARRPAMPGRSMLSNSAANQ